jgi:hypothetical protein
MSFDDLNERGLRDGLIEIAGVKRALRSSLQNAEQQVGVYEAEAHALRKINGIVEQVEAHMRGRLEQIERKNKELIT